MSFTHAEELGNELQVPVEVWENLAVKVSSAYSHAVAVIPQ